MLSKKNTLLATVSSVALLATTGAQAADLPARVAKAPPMPVEVWNWTGFYAGMTVGAAQPTTSMYDSGGPNGPFASPLGTEVFKFDSWRAAVSGHAGYNWQFNQWVVGVEGDLSWVDGKDTATGRTTFLVPVIGNADMSWFATLRGRLGYSFGRGLVYVTGGLVVADVSASWGSNFPPVPLIPFNLSETRASWIVGGGFEYMVARNWTVRVEGLYSDLGDTTVSGRAFGLLYTSKFKNELAVARAGFSYKW
jgi:outer membrane immunogenic protein